MGNYRHPNWVQDGFTPTPDDRRAVARAYRDYRSWAISPLDAAKFVAFSESRGVVDYVARGRRPPPHAVARSLLATHVYETALAKAGRIKHWSRSR